MKKIDKSKNYKAPTRVNRINNDGQNTITDEITYLQVKKVISTRRGTFQGEPATIFKVKLEDGTTREYVESFLIEV